MQYTMVIKYIFINTQIRRIFNVKKLKMSRTVTLTFEEGCNKYLENCRQRNLREGTINHYNKTNVRLQFCYLFFFIATFF